MVVVRREPDMRTRKILTTIVLAAFCASDAVAAQTDARGEYPNEVIEEVVVVGESRCGTWPIEHQRLRGCEFAELKKEILPRVLGLRPKLFSDCLICQGNRCVTKPWPEDRTTEKLLCKRLFWTPTRVSRFMNPGARFSALRVSYTFKISTDGKVEDIELISFEGDIEEEELVRLIGDGASKTRFEPIVVADVAYEIVGLRDTFILNEFGVP